MTSKRKDGRGHRKRLSETEETVKYQIEVVESTKEKLDKLGKPVVRAKLDKMKGVKE